MGGSYSKNSFFAEPEEYQTVEMEDETSWYRYDKEWAIWWYDMLPCDKWLFKIQRQFPEKTRVEFIYQFVFAHKCQKWRKGLVIRGVGELEGRYSVHNVYHKCSGTMPYYDQMSFQAIVHVFLDGNTRMFNFYDDIFGESKVFWIKGQVLAVPMKAVTKRAPLLAIAIKMDNLSQKQKMYLNEFLQILHGVQVQLTDKNLKGVLKLATKYKVLNVKRYCEQQLIRRDDFEFSEKRKFKMACNYNLNILMNKLLRDVETLKELAKFVMYTTNIKKINQNISKLLIKKMYEL